MLLFYILVLIRSGHAFLRYRRSGDAVMAKESSATLCSAESIIFTPTSCLSPLFLSSCFPFPSLFLLYPA